MIPLRVVGIASSIFQIAFAMSAGITPMLIQHCILLPMNAYRLFEQIRLVRKARTASDKDLSLDCLIPFMTKRQANAGQILFHKGDLAEEMFLVTSGRLRLSEIAIDVLPGGVVGELGLLAPNQQRTQTLECIEDAEILQIGYDRIKSLCLENPSFGFYLLRLTSARLFQNIAKFEVELEKRDREILRVRASTGKNVRRGVSKVSRRVDSGAMDQRHDRANAKDRHHAFGRLNEPSTPGRVDRQQS